MKRFRHVFFTLISVIVIIYIVFLFFPTRQEVLSGSSFSEQIPSTLQIVPNRLQNSPSNASFSEAIGIPAHSLTKRRSTQDVMQDIDSIAEETEGALVYQWFLELQNLLEEHGHVAYEIYTRISQLDSDTVSSRRKLSLLYGVLAQSTSAEALKILHKSVADDQSEYHMIQAIAALGDVPNPDAQTAQVLWDQSQRHADPLVRSTALLALGSVAHRGVDESQLIRENLLALSQNKLELAQEGVLIAAMGNHGDSEYWPYLQRQGQSVDEAIRASALYSSRSLPQEEVNQWITEVAVSDQSLYVKNEALKVLAIRSSRFDVSRAISKIALSKHDPELHMHATNLLISLASDYRDSSQESLTQVYEDTPFANVKDIIRQTPLN
ncbi:MAG: HEAT repeat domain-containing protein [Oligoflexus sp.]